MKAAEGCKLVAYKDSLGYWTIGYGHLLDQTIDWAGHEILQNVADQLLAGDLDDAEAHCRLLPEFDVLDTPARKNAVTELVFNLGLRHWLSFKHTRDMLQKRDWVGARNGLLLSTWATQVGPHRSGRIARYILTGTYPS